MNAPRSYDDIKELAKTTGRRIPDLLAMASVNDPFYIMPAQAKQGEWFAALWDRFDLPHGVHLRRIHYKLISQAEPVLMVDGRPYQNTELCWQHIGSASKAARDAWREAEEAYGKRLSELKGKTREIVVGYRDRLESLRQAMNADLEPVKEELDGLRQAIKADMEEFDPDLPPRPESELALPEKFDGLFDSRRNYLEQLRYYKTAAPQND